MSIKGKKNIIEKILYYSFFLMKKKLRFYPLFIFFEVLEKIKISIGLKIDKNK
jgi:ribosomal protein S7